MTDRLSIKRDQKIGKSLLEAIVDAFAILGVLSVFYFGYQHFSKKFDIHSDCRNIAGGVSCAITHSSDSAETIAVCAEVKRVCSSGLPSVGKGCFVGLVPAKSLGTLLIADSEFSNFKDCAQVTAQTDSLQLMSSAAAAERGESK